MNKLEKFLEKHGEEVIDGLKFEFYQSDQDNECFIVQESGFHIFIGHFKDSPELFLSIHIMFFCSFKKNEKGKSFNKLDLVSYVFDKKSGTTDLTNLSEPDLSFVKEKIDYIIEELGFKDIKGKRFSEGEVSFDFKEVNHEELFSPTLLLWHFRNKINLDKEMAYSLLTNPFLFNELCGDEGRTTKFFDFLNWAKNEDNFEELIELNYSY